MPNRSDRQLALVGADFVVAATSFLGALRWRFGPEFISTWSGVLGLPHPGIVAAILGAGFVVVLWAAGAYRTERFWSVRAEVGVVLKSTVISALVVMSLLYFFRFEDFSRLTLAGFLVSTAAGAVGVRWLVKYLPGRDSEGIRVLVAGTDGAGRIMDRLRRLPDGPATVVGYVGHASTSLEGIARLGALSDLPGILSEQIVDEVIVCLPVEEWSRLDAIAGVCEEQGKVMRVPVDVVSYSLRKGHIEDLDTIPMLSLVSSPSGHFALVIKRAIDIVISGVLLFALIPLHLVVSTILLAKQGSPVLFRQMRGGLNGRPFEVLKYRTMDVDAEERKVDLSELNERIGPAFKVTDDPRVTRFGRFLRKASIDELPQLWNVFMGDMSLVGPRPQPISEVADYDPWHRRRLTVKPGITGLWQVTSRHDPSFDRWVDLDLQYIDRWSVWLDLRILVKTPVALFRSPGT